MQTKRTEKSGVALAGHVSCRYWKWNGSSHFHVTPGQTTDEDGTGRNGMAATQPPTHGIVSPFVRILAARYKGFLQTQGARKFYEKRTGGPVADGLSNDLTCDFSKHLTFLPHRHLTSKKLSWSHVRVDIFDESIFWPLHFFLGANVESILLSTNINSISWISIKIKWNF